MKNCKYMSRIFSFLLTAAMLFILSACGKSGNAEDTVTQGNFQTAGNESAGNNAVVTASGNSDTNILIVYFTAAENSGVDAVSSASYTTIGGTAVGRVRAVADMIQAQTGGELFSIQTSVVYPADGGELIEQAAEEQNENFRPELTSHIENPDDYDIIFVGFPNWWYDMPMALYSFFEEYDFSGKTIIPFNVHNGSHFSGTISTIQELEPDAVVIEDGFTVSERDVADAGEDVMEWLNRLGIKKSDGLVQTGWITGQILEGNDGEIHYSYYLPESYDGEHRYPMMVIMPGYDMMWFGEESSGANLSWSGLLAWTKLNEEMIVVSAQLTDWHEKSARQSIELTEYFLENFAVDKDRIYAAGYSAGGETMSQAVSMRPDLYAAYLHGASQWDGTYDSIAENETAVYIFMAENDEYYGSQKARDAYNSLYEAYQSEGWTDERIEEVLQLEIPDNEYFNSRGIYNYHGGGNILFEDESILNWIISQRK